MALFTASTTCGLTFGDPLTTRDTVARLTPAAAATISSVGADGVMATIVAGVRALSQH